jgi:hypothetical protein
MESHLLSQWKTNKTTTKSKPKISLKFTNNLPDDVKCVDIIKQILATDFSVI